jgi:ParB-like chromosome segregation protein Spo0J
MEKKSAIVIKDIPLSLLEPINSNFNERDLAGVRISMQGIEMMEFLVVCKKGEKYQISDGNKRYRILHDEGFVSAPCIVIPHLDIYTASRQVIDVSPTEQKKMIDKVSETVPEDKIAAAIGKLTLKPCIDKNLENKLHAVIKTAFEGKKLSKAALHELKKVAPKRQAEIFKELKQIKTYSLDLIKTKILQTPKEEMVVHGEKSPLTKNQVRQNSMIKTLREFSDESLLLEHRNTTFVQDVIKILTYVRGFLDKEDIYNYVENKYPEMLKKFHEILEREVIE